MNLSAYINELETMKALTAWELLSLVRVVPPYREAASLVFRIEEVGQHWQLRLSPVGIALDPKTETAAIDYFGMEELTDDVLLIRHLDSTFFVNFALVSGHLNEVCKIDTKGNREMIALTSPQEIERRKGLRYNKHELMLAFSKALKAADKPKKLS